MHTLTVMKKEHKDLQYQYTFNGSGGGDGGSVVAAAAVMVAVTVLVAKVDVVPGRQLQVCSVRARHHIVTSHRLMRHPYIRPQRLSSLRLMTISDIFGRQMACSKSLNKRIN